MVKSKSYSICFLSPASIVYPWLTRFIFDLFTFIVPKQTGKMEIKSGRNGFVEAADFLAANWKRDQSIFPSYATKVIKTKGLVIFKYNFWVATKSACSIDSVIQLSVCLISENAVRRKCIWKQ